MTSLANLLATKRVVAYLGICRRTLHGMVKAGVFPRGEVVVGKRRLWTRRQVDQWLDDRRRAGRVGPRRRGRPSFAERLGRMP
jgi:predicted DNA-binding transcriptional regulator AlpA